MVRRSPMLLVVALAAATLTACGGPPEGCAAFPTADAQAMVSTSSRGTVVAASRVPADGGSYVSAKVQMLDGGTDVATWYLTNPGDLRTSVGEVTALFSDYPSSEKVGITVASKGFRTSKSCLDALT